MLVEEEVVREDKRVVVLEYRDRLDLLLDLVRDLVPLVVLLVVRDLLVVLLDQDLLVLVDLVMVRLWYYQTELLYQILLDLEKREVE